LQRHRIEGEAGQRALTWLGAVGADLSVLQAQQAHAPFYQAHMYADDSQGVVSMFWYTDSRRRQVQGMSFLIDYHPPWEGAIKDVTVYPVHAPAWVTRTYLAFWADRLTPLRPLEAAEAKRRVLHGLEVNRREGIRLPSDLIAGRDLFLEHVPDLPDTADTPAFTARDFEVLSHLARSPEELRVYEQTVGRRVRLPDGKELLVMGPPLDEDEW